jgi:hypothetical protein
MHDLHDAELRKHAAEIAHVEVGPRRHAAHTTLPVPDLKRLPELGRLQLERRIKEQRRTLPQDGICKSR